MFRVAWIDLMAWAVEFTDEFGAWWQTLSARAQDAYDEHLDTLASEGLI